MSDHQTLFFKTFILVSRPLIIACLAILFLLIFYLIRAPLIKKRRELESQLKLSLRKYELENLELDQINFYGLLETTSLFAGDRSD